MGPGPRADRDAASVRTTSADRITLPRRAAPPTLRPEAIGVPDAAGLVRQRLNRQLDRFADVRIGAVIAPAGSGKTTALAHWARSSALDITWWRATPRAGDPVAHAVRGLAEAVHVLAPRRARATCLDSLADRLAEHDGTPVLVIDDFHHVDHPEVGQVLAELLDSSRARLVVVSRVEPSLNLARSELPSLVVGVEDLRFRQPEIQDLFDSVHDAPLSDDDSWCLARRTDGLPAVLQLFQQATRGLGEQARRDLLREAPGGTTFANGYVAREILTGLEAADLRLLRRTSPLETFTVARCAELMDADCWPRLRALARRGVLRRGRGGYGVSRVVRRHLLDELREELGADAFLDHVSSCAARLDADGDPAAAVRAYVSVGSWGSALAVLDGDGAAVLADPDLDWLDGACVEGPWRRVGRAVRELRAGRFDAARDELGVTPPQAPAALVELDARVRRVLLTWTDGDVAPGPEWYEQLRATVHRPDPLRYSRSATTGPGDVEQRLLHAAECAVAGDVVTARRLSQHASGGRAADLALAGLSVLLSGASSVERLADEAEREGVRWISRLAAGLADPTRLPRLVSDADALGDRWGALLMAGLRAVLDARAGTPSVSEFEDLVHRCRGLRAPALEAWARSGLALAAAGTGSPDAVREAELAVGFAHTAQVPGALAVAWGVLGRLRNDLPLLADATAEAERIGLGCRPWEWLTGQSASAWPVATAERAAPLEVRCFGGFEILVDGDVPGFEGVRPRARSLLRMLALHAGTPVHRELLVDAMWPQLDSTAGTHNLHVCISSLRASLEPGVARGASRLLVRDGDRYLLALPPGAMADLRDFDACTREADQRRTHGEVAEAAAALERALQLYVGDVLPEDGPAEWVVGVRDRYRVRAAEAAALLAELRLGEGRARDAAAAAQRSIDIEPCRDASWRLLIKAYDAAQDLAAAERARRSYASVLASLGVVESTADLLREARGR